MNEYIDEEIENGISELMNDERIPNDCKIRIKMLYNALGSKAGDIKTEIYEEAFRNSIIMHNSRYIKLDTLEKIISKV